MSKTPKAVRAWAVILNGKYQDIGLTRDCVFIDARGEKIVCVEIRPLKKKVKR